jgi:hypothetical protein
LKCRQNFDWGSLKRRDRPFGRPVRRWEDKIKIDLREVGFEGVAWVDMAQDGNRLRSLLNTTINLRISNTEGNVLPILATISVSIRTLLNGSGWLVDFSFIAQDTLYRCVFVNTVNIFGFKKRRTIKSSLQ